MDYKKILKTMYPPIVKVFTRSSVQLMLLIAWPFMMFNLFNYHSKVVVGRYLQPRGSDSSILRTIRQWNLRNKYTLDKFLSQEHV